MTKEELKKFDKENEQIAINTLKKLYWHQSINSPSKACVTVEDILPIIIKFIADKRSSEDNIDLF